MVCPRSAGAAGISSPPVPGIRRLATVTLWTVSTITEGEDKPGPSRRQLPDQMQTGYL